MAFKKSLIVEPILITGSNGFLGSHLTQYFLEKNTKIYSISHGKTKNPNIEQIGDDILNFKNLSYDFSTILHFAALTDIQFCEKNQKQCFEINIDGTKNILDLARKNDSRLVFASSSHVYGKPDSLPINEQSSINPISIHAKSKVKAESLCEEYAKLYGMNIDIVRTFSIYGSNSPSYALISRIINQILFSEKIILGNLKSKRDFLHISDFLSVIDIIIQNKTNGCSIFNIGYGESFSIHDICDRLLHISGTSKSIEFDSSLVRNNDIDDLVCDNSKIKALGWTPKLLLNDGLSEVFHWFKKNSKNLS